MSVQLEPIYLETTAQEKIHKTKEKEINVILTREKAS